LKNCANTHFVVIPAQNFFAVILNEMMDLH